MEPTPNRHPQISADHVRKQFMRRGGLENACFFLDTIAQRMLERLQYIRLKPKRIVDAGCGPGLRAASLFEMYPDAEITGIDINPAAVEAASQAGSGKKLLGLLPLPKSKQQRQLAYLVADAAQSRLPPQRTDLIWSNLMLHWHPDPVALFEEWHRLLATDGLVMFSYCAGVTCQELRQAVEAAGWQTEAMPYTDMHDAGDMMLAAGFQDPVMDQEILTLTYKTPEAFLKDVRALGGNAAANRRASLPGRRQYTALLEALEAQRNPQDGLIHLSIEVAYGHAWRGSSHKRGDVSYVSLDSLRRS